MNEETKSIIEVPRESTFTKTVGLPPISVQLPAVFYLSRRKAVAWAIFVPISLLMVGILTAVLPKTVAEYVSGQISFLTATILFLIFLGGSLVFLIIGYSSAWTIYVMWREAGPILTISEHGLVDLRVSHDMIPWSSIAAVEKLRGPYSGYSLKLTLKHGSKVTRKGPDRLLVKLWPRLALRLIVDIKSLSANKSIAQQAILHLVAMAHD